MIKVIKKKAIEEPKVYKATCFECGAELEYEEADTYIGALGGRELWCPSCGEKVPVDEPYGIDLNSNNIEFPKHFMPPSENAVDIDNETIQEWVQCCLRKSEEDPDCGFYISGSGNTMVIVLNFADERNIYVTKKYWECSIPREEM